MKIRISSSSLLVGLLANVFMIGSVAIAEQINIVDAAGNTRSMATLAAGTEQASVKINLETTGTESVSGVEVSLIDESNGKVVQTAMTDASGEVTFLNVPAGTYKVKSSNNLLALASVEILDPFARAQLAGADAGVVGAGGGAGAGAVGGGIAGTGLTTGGLITGGLVAGGAVGAGALANGQKNDADGSVPPPNFPNFPSAS